MVEKISENVSSSKEIMPFEMGYLPENFKQKALITLKETNENKTQGLQRIKEFIEKDKLFDDTECDEDLLLLFLRNEEFSVNKAFERLKNAMSLKKNYIEMFSNQSYEILSISFTKKIATFLPYRCPDGCAIFYVNMDNWIPEEFPVLEVKRLIPIILRQALRDPMTQVNGFKVIFDGKSNPLRHLRHCTFSNLYLIYHGSQNCLPGRFQSYHLINQSLTTRFCLKVMTHFFSEELKKKIHIHASPEELFEFFPSSIIPTAYGGQQGEYDMTGWLKKVMQPDMLANLCGRTKS